jgi:hypothetical protein
MRKPKLSTGTIVVILLLLMCLVGCGNLWASWDQSHAASAQAHSTEAQLNAFKRKLAEEQAEQARAGAALEKALCSDVGTMAAIPAPAGNPAANPSRAYEQAEHRAWAGLDHDVLRCTR